MGVYIPNMSKPKGCRWCPLTHDTICYALTPYKADETNGEQRRPACPLIEIDLVRCKECKWGNKDNEGILWCEHAIGGIMKPTDFCSYGERRADE